MSNSSIFRSGVFTPTLPWHYLEVLHWRLHTGNLLQFECCEMGLSSLKLWGQAWNFDVTFVPSVQSCVHFLPSALQRGSSTLCFNNGVKRVETGAQILLQGLRCTLAKEHVGKLVFDSQTCSLVVTMDEISFTLPQWNHDQNRTWLCKSEGKSNWK